MREFLIVAFLLIAIAIICLVLLQQGKGAGMGASFGAGASGTLFGSSGAGNFLTRMTGILAALFFIICLVLANFSGKPAKSSDNGQWSELDVPETQRTMPRGTPLTVPTDVPEQVVPSVTENKEVVTDIPQ